MLHILYHSARHVPDVKFVVICSSYICLFITVAVILSKLTPSSITVKLWHFHKHESSKSSLTPVSQIWIFHCFSFQPCENKIKKEYCFQSMIKSLSPFYRISVMRKWISFRQRLHLDISVWWLLFMATFFYLYRQVRLIYVSDSAVSFKTETVYSELVLLWDPLFSYIHFKKRGI